jgi:DNA-binding NarL/FixJ family response regulator
MAKRLLIVDDEPRLLRALEMMLRVAGYEVKTARNGREALVRLAETLPDLVIADIRMPLMDGYALVQHLRDSPRTNLIPVIFLTAKDAVADRITGFRAGVDHYLTKPFEAEELLAVISNVLDRVARTHAGIARLVGNHDGDQATDFFDEALTEAENRIAGAVARGLSNKDIASEFGISVRTVETHIRRILAKKNFSNRVEIARHVMERQLSAPETD